MVDVVLLTTDGRTIILPRRIDPNPDTALLIFPLWADLSRPQFLPRLEPRSLRFFPSRYPLAT